MHKQTPQTAKDFNPGVADPLLVVHAFELLRLKGLPWRRLLAVLAAPLRRLHGYRNTRTRSFRHALCARDCTGRSSGDLHGNGRTEAAC